MLELCFEELILCQTFTGKHYTKGPLTKYSKHAVCVLDIIVGHK